MTLWSRVLALLVVLAVPLALALASQSLAARPGPAPVSTGPIQLSTQQAGQPARPAQRPTPDVPAPGTGPDAPRVVTPVVPRAVPSDDEGPDEVDDADDMVGQEGDPDDG